MTETENPAMQDTEETIDELIERLEKTYAFIAKFTEEDYKNAENVKVVLPWMKHAMPTKYIPAGEYLNNFAIPNFYFHVVTAYGLLRKNGIEIGKMDYIGRLELMDL